MHTVRAPHGSGKRGPAPAIVVAIAFNHNAPAHGLLVVCGLLVWFSASSSLHSPCFFHTQAQATLTEHMEVCDEVRQALEADAKSQKNKGAGQARSWVAKLVTAMQVVGWPQEFAKEVANSTVMLVFIFLSVSFRAGHQWPAHSHYVI